MHPQFYATKRRQLLTPCLPVRENEAGKQIFCEGNFRYALNFNGKTGAGEGIRTLDPNLGKVVLYP